VLFFDFFYWLLFIAFLLIASGLSCAQVEGTGERPRLAVFRSNNHIHAQVCAPNPSLKNRVIVGPLQSQYLLAITIRPRKVAYEKGTESVHLCEHT
jgi:hypothetical protein